MAEPLKRTPDFPNFDTYPGAAPASGHLLPREGTPSHVAPEGAMNHAAERVGGAVGSVVAAARHLPQHLNDTLDSVKNRLVLVKGRGVREVNERAADLKQAASKSARDAQERARWVAREYPLHVIAGVAALAFVAGLTMRIWRGSRG